MYVRVCEGETHRLKAERQSGGMENTGGLFRNAENGLFQKMHKSHIAFTCSSPETLAKPHSLGSNLKWNWKQKQATIPALPERRTTKTLPPLSPLLELGSQCEDQKLPHHPGEAQPQP